MSLLCLKSPIFHKEHNVCVPLSTRGFKSLVIYDLQGAFKECNVCGQRFSCVQLHLVLIHK